MNTRNVATASSLSRTDTLFVLGLSLILCLCMVLMALSHLRWDESTSAALVARDNLAQSRRFALLAHVDTQRLLAGETGVPRTSVIAQLDRALLSARDLTQGRGSIAGFALGLPVTGELAAATAAYVASLADARAIMERQLDGFEAHGEALLFAQRDVDMRAAAVEAALLEHLSQQHQVLRRHDMITLALACILGLGGMFYLYVSHRRRDGTLAALIESDARVRAFVDSLPEAAFMFDRLGRYIEAYGASDARAATQPETLVGRTLDERFPAELSARFLAVIGDALEHRRTRSYEYELEVDGEVRMFDARVSPVPGSDRVVWVAWDVTARRQAELHVRTLSRLYNFLGQVNQTIVWSVSEDELFRRICRVAVESGGYRCAWLISGDHEAGVLELRATAGVVPPDLPRFVRSPAEGAPLTLDVMRSGRVRRLARFDDADPWCALVRAAGGAGYVGLPIRLNDRVVAVLGMLARHVDPDDADEAQLLEEVMLDLSFAMGRLRDEAQRQRVEQNARLQAAALRSTRDGIVVSTLDGAVVSVNQAFCTLIGHDENDVIGRLLTDLLEMADAPSIFAAIDAGLRGEGFWQGEIAARRHDGDPWSGWLSCAVVRDDEDRVTHHVAVLTDITQARRTEEMLEHLAQYDPLTDLPNRLLMHAQLTHNVDVAARLQQRVAVILMDLDNFKTINDGLGHAAGDEVLSAVAQRLRARLDVVGTLGRQGGDEFMLVLDDMQHPGDAARVAQDMLGCLSDPIHLTSGQDIYLQASIGISIYPDDGTRAEELIRDADTAMYQAKRSGRNAVRFYTDTLTVEAGQRLSLETRLRRALHAGHFELRFQPLVSLSDEGLIGAEVLVRLVDDDPHEIGPAEFIPVMESSGLIVELGDWVRENACRQGRAWLDAGHAPGSLAVNLSVVEIRRGGLEERLAQTLRDTGYPAAGLELEMTESSLMDQGEQAQLFLAALKRLGLRLSIDDFGTGYSSLAYLKRLPVDKLKIDRSFIRDIPHDDSDMELASTIIALGHNLGLTVLAEGVETRAQFDFLKTRGCDACQGYLFSKPLTAEEFERRFLASPRSAGVSAAAAERGGEIA
ncbi:MAG: EAL domain-containing protein [Methyloversatilis sp.]|nr:EAL domain-containing protein [Methyloversatilis sp.]MBP6195006.1 EAL domain-containing protein [Methyloversatilis sp.]MBP9117784.1 EAL domain-containing protein [Methyloversatilis sp.]